MAPNPPWPRLYAASRLKELAASTYHVPATGKTVQWVNKRKGRKLFGIIRSAFYGLLLLHSLFQSRFSGIEAYALRAPSLQRRSRYNEKPGVGAVRSTSAVPPLKHSG